MDFLFPSFKRHYRRVQNVYQSMVKTGTFGFKGTYAHDQGTSAQATTPDAELTMRFIILMRRFLDPNDPLFYKSVWQTLNDQYGKEINASDIDTFTKLESSLISGGAIRFNVNDNKMTSEQIYHIVAEGYFFNQDKTAKAFLEANSQVPWADELFRYQFYDYTSLAYQIASFLFNAISQIEKTDLFKAQAGKQEATSNHCIFCLTRIGKFTSEEHILPEGLGNTDWILPKGYVCDKCNNETLSRLDKALVNSPLFALQKVRYVQYDKDGRLPQARLGTTVLKKTSPLNISMRADEGSDAIKIVEKLDEGWTRFSFNETLPEKFDERFLARALSKVALELVAADHGQDFVCSKRYDAVRSFILKGSNFRNNLIMGTKFMLKPEIDINYILLEEGTLVKMGIYGVYFFLNLEEQPIIKPAEQNGQANFVSFRLAGKSNWQGFRLDMVPDPSIYDRLPEQYRPKPQTSLEGDQNKGQPQD